MGRTLNSKLFELFLERMKVANTSDSQEANIANSKMAYGHSECLSDIKFISYMPEYPGSSISNWSTVVDVYGKFSILQTLPDLRAYN